MKKIIKVTNKDTVLYEGKIINMPFKDEYVIRKSIELFDDDDPCIIHKSYIYKEYATSIANLFNGKKEILAKDFIDALNIVDIEGIEKAILTIEG